MRAPVVTALLVLSLCVAGCSGEGEQEQTGPTLPPVAASPTPTATEAVPSAATEATPEGAAEFARFFAQEVNRAYRDLDAEAVNRLSAPDCATCQRYVETINQIRDTGASVNPEYGVSVVDVAVPGQEVGQTAVQATIVLDIGALVVTSEDGAELLREDPNPQAVQTLDLVRVGDSWAVQEVTVA